MTDKQQLINGRIACQNWYKRNKKRHIQHNCANHRRYYKEDPNFRIAKLFRGRLYDGVKKQRTRRLLKSSELIGCSWEEYKLHQQKQFKEGMTWENYGSVWEIDHIIPIAKFDLSKKSEQKRAFHFTNTQPLFGFENKSKNRKFMRSKYK